VKPDVEYEQFRPIPGLDRAEMESLQRDIAAVADFADDLAFDPETAGDPDGPLVAGVDQAFLTKEEPEQAVSAVVITQGEQVIERAHSISPVEIPYLPGLLAFREGGPILDAFAALSTIPDLSLFDGSGRIHYSETGLATHIGVMLDLPSVGVAKSLLCGTPERPVDRLAEGDRVQIRADNRMAKQSPVAVGEPVGHAYQSRQYPNSNRINPLYVSPGHRVSNRTAVTLVERCGGPYKLPEPTRLADAYAEEVKQTYQ
jgi:deoxyribonuclease V